MKTPVAQTWPGRSVVLSPVLFLTLLVASSFAAAPSVADDKLQMDELVLQPGYSISVWAEGVEDARSLARGDDGTIYVGSRRKDKVHAVRDTDGDGVADRVNVVLRDLYMPNGVAYREGSLYVAEVNRLLRLDDIGNRLEDPPEPVVLYDDLPEERHHGWKFIRFGPDGKLYVPVGAPCNICESDDPYTTILRMDPDGSNREVYARGVRNTVGFDWHPETGDLWFTDNGRDMMGDDIPPDELNRVTEAGQHFGYPYCHGQDIADPEFGEKRDCADLVAPALDLGPHVAAIGMRFYEGEMFPEELHGQIIIAEHGSWNRTTPLGYRIMTVQLDDSSRATSYDVLVEGWLVDGKFWGRPADVLVLPDGSLLISDDLRGVIYRLTYG